MGRGVEEGRLGTRSQFDQKSGRKLTLIKLEMAQFVKSQKLARTKKREIENIEYEHGCRFVG